MQRHFQKLQLAAGGGRPFGWPLLKEAVSKSTGMPIAVITPAPSGDGQGEEEQQRAVTVAPRPVTATR